MPTLKGLKKAGFFNPFRVGLVRCYLPGVAEKNATTPGSALLPFQGSFETACGEPRHTFSPDYEVAGPLYPVHGETKE